MALTLFQVLLVATTAQFSLVGCSPVSVMQGDLCRRLNGRKYYLEADTKAIITGTNVTLPAYPRIATQSLKTSATYHHSSRRHRREGPEEIGVMDPRFRRNITSITLSSLGNSNMVIPKAFVPDTTRLLTPLSTPALETPPSPSEIATTSPTILLTEDEEDLETESEISTAVSQPAKCGVEIITRPDCHLEITFEKVNLPSCSHDKSCRCDYLRLREPPYRGTGGLDVCSTGDDIPKTFTSQTKEVRLDFLYTRTYEDAFTVSISAKRNKYRITGRVNNTIGFIKSPFFPELYPKEHWMEYELVAKEENARIIVTFLDFQLSPWSFVESQP
ncbi:hypothetical protein SK128_015633 [Halocaridina rubra]|uniref:Uncharacterized protein n=1 Tax=Halocaridina rubra TaxID=373956 RepID=A0AAN9A1T2_HALRR